jgi:hypothetical protein
MNITLLDLILKARASEDGETTLYFDKNREGIGRWLRVDTRKMARTLYIFGSGFSEVDYLTRRAAANICREA